MPGRRLVPFAWVALTLACRPAGDDARSAPPLTALDGARPSEPDDALEPGPAAEPAPSPPPTRPQRVLCGDAEPLQTEPAAPSTPPSAAPSPGTEPASKAASKRPAAAGFPQHDPRREVTLWGALRTGEDIVEGPAYSTGAWQQRDGRLAPASADRAREQAYFPRSAAAHLAEGLVRARFELGGRLEAAVLVRQDFRGPTPELLSGYGLLLDRSGARLYRWDRGMALPLGERVELAKLSARASLELVITMVGPQLLANVYDGESLEHLATLAAHDTTYAFGCVGLWIGEDHAVGSALTWLTAMDAAPEAAPPHLRDGPPQYGVRPPSDITPFGNTRFVWIRRTDLAILPESLRARLEAEVEDPAAPDDPEAGRALLFLDTTGYERLLRSGVEVLAVDSNAPWSAFDPAFRARAAAPKPTGRGRGFVLDDSYKDPALVEQLLRAYHERYPDLTRLVELGRSHQGRPIWALRISDPADDPDEPAVLLSGAHHGSELLSVEYVLDAVDVLLAGYGQDPRVSGWVDGLEIWCVPLVNVDGNHMFVHESRFATRKNGRDGNRDGQFDPFEGVDLNRNYPFAWGGEGGSDMPMHKWYRGPAPGSEPETQAIMQLADQRRFAAVLSFHTFGTDIYSAYGARDRKDPEPDVNKAIGEALAAATPVQPNGLRYGVRRGPYPVSGSDQDWHLHAHGSVAFVIEGSHHNPALDVRNQAVAATRPLWQALLDRVLGGPWIGGHVVDRAGAPVPARVMIREIQTFEGERWTTRPSDGRFDRAVLGPGRYTLEIEPDGRPAFTRTVQVANARVELQIVVEDP